MLHLLDVQVTERDFTDLRQLINDRFPVYLEHEDLLA